MTKPSAAPHIIRVEHDAEGLRLAFLELLEESFQCGKIERGAGVDVDSPQRAKAEADRRAQHMERLLKGRTLAAGYYTFAAHIFRLDAEREAGFALDPHSLASFEGSALRILADCRNASRAKHPPCGRCGIPQDNRHHPKCTNCGAEFVGKVKK